MVLQIKKHLSWRNNSIQAVAIVFAGVAVGLLGYSYTHAATSNLLTSQLTNDKIGSAGGVDGAVDLHLKKIQDIAEVLRNKMGAYYPADGNGNAPDGKQKSIKIIQGKEGRLCHVADTIQGELVIDIKVDGDIASYSIPMQKVCKGNNFYNNTFKFPTGGHLYKHDSGFYEARVDIHYSGVSYGKSSNTNDINYRVQLLGGSSKRILALRANTNSQQFGLRSAWEDDPSKARTQQVRAEVPFGYPCTITEKKIDEEDRTVQLYDADSVFGDTYMWVTKNGKKLQKDDYVDPQTHPSWRIERWVPDMQAWKLKGSDQKSNKLVIQEEAIKGKGGVEYKLVVYNDGKNKDEHFSPHQNTLSVAIPYDSIYSTPTCNYKLKPSVNPPAKSKSTVAVGTKVPVQGHVDVTDGYDNDKHDWQLTAKIYDSLPSLTGATNSLSACKWREGVKCDPIVTDTDKFGTGPFHTKTYEYNTSGLEAGSWVCFVMSVRKPTYDASANTWRHSNLKCVAVGGEVVNATTVTPNTYSYYPNLAVSSIIKNDKAYPLVDTFYIYKYPRKYNWQIIEAKYDDKPSNIGTAEKGDCGAIEDADDPHLLKDSCQVVKQGANLFPYSGSGPLPCSGNDPCVKKAKSKQKGPDPIGTWTCYTFSYLTNPPPTGQLRAKIRKFVGDWNDTNNNSSDPGWSDDHWRETITDYDANGNVVGHHYVWHGGDDADFDEIYQPYYNKDPYPDPPKYKFTPFKPMSCSKSGIDPKVQIRGNDLKVVGDINTSLRTMEVGDAVGTYGSGGEYGVLSGGSNVGMASGAGLILRGAASSDQGDWSTLTFTNNTPGVYGNFNGVPDPDPPAETTTTINLGNGATLGSISYAKGTKAIYRVNGTLKINGDLKYPNSYNRIKELPRIIIIAENIEIAPEVKQIDPWLVATNSISTCGPPRGDDWDAADLYTGNAGICTKPLTFNGPVYTTNLYLYRTGGSRVPKDDLNPDWTNPDSEIDPNDYCEDSDESSGCGDDDSGRRAALSAPAEVFNLRPDAFLSSFAGTNIRNPVATTDKITELPPRF